MPGGNTRTVLHYEPFPLTFVRGEGPYLFSADGARYVDFLGEFTAGLYGHSEPAIIEAIRSTLDSGIGFGSTNGLEQRLAPGPTIGVPTITLEGDANGAPHADAHSYAGKFSGKYGHRVITGGIGHNLPQEAPQAFAKAVIDVDRF